MDADWIESQRDQFLSRREKRWSMNSQRLEEIVAELMKPISHDNRRSFDTDLSALLEEYLTEAGLHALDAAEAGEGGGSDVVVPNFTEIALLLQQSADIYGRKVDFLYRHVLQVSDNLHNSVQELELANTSGASDEPHTPNMSRRKRKASAAPGLGDFSEIELEACAHASREAEAPRPPPTLPRMYIELEPRVATHADTPLRDYAADSIGLLADFQVTWRLHDGLLVDELAGSAARGSSSLRPISLLELQAAIAAAAPAEPPRGLVLRPLGASTPLPPGADTPPPPGADTPPPPGAGTPLPPLPLADAEPLMPPPLKRERKRRSEVKIDDIFKGNVKIVFGKDLIRKLKEVREFSVPKKWISDVVGKRKSQILSARKNRPPDEADEFPGWSASEVALALAALPAARADADSDDDGFFEQSSGGGDIAEVDSLRADDSGLPRHPAARRRGRGAWRRGRARARRRRAARAAGRRGRAQALPLAALRARRARGGRVAAHAHGAVFGERGQRGDSERATAVAELVLAAPGVARPAPVLAGRGRGRAVPAVTSPRTGRPL